MKSNLYKEAICWKAESRIIGDGLRVLKMEVGGQNYQGARPGREDDVRAQGSSVLTAFPAVWGLCHAVCAGATEQTWSVYSNHCTNYAG